MVLSQPLDLNILPQHYRARRIALPLVAAIGAAVVLLLGLIPAYAALAEAQAQTTSFQARLDQAQAALTENQVDQEQLERVDQQIQQTRDQTAQLRAELDAFGQQRPLRSDVVKGVALALVPSVHLTGLVQEEESTFIITGEANDAATMLNYTRVLESSGRFANLRVLSMVNVDTVTRTLEFSIEIEQ